VLFKGGGMLVWKNKSLGKLKNNMTVLPKLRLCWGNNPAYDPNEVASLQIPVGRLRALPQSSRGEAWEGKRRIICPQPGRVCKMVKKGCSHRCLEGTL